MKEVKIKSITFLIDGEFVEVPIKDIFIETSSDYCGTCRDYYSSVSLRLGSEYKLACIYDSHLGDTDYVD